MIVLESLVCSGIFGGSAMKSMIVLTFVVAEQRMIVLESVFAA